MKKKAGFTLIELLVIIVVICILVAILLPVFARARENARRSSCMSNLKQISLAMLQYTQDYDERMTYARYRNYSWEGTPSYTWTTAIQPYLKSDQVLFCPSQPQKIAYGTCTNGTNRPILYLSADNTTENANFNAPRHLASYLYPSEACMVTELKTAGANPIAYGNPTGYSYGTLGYIHFDGANVAFVDGHAKWMKKEFFEGEEDKGNKSHFTMFAPTS